MNELKFYQGVSSQLPSTINPYDFYITTDEPIMYVGGVQFYGNLKLSYDGTNKQIKLSTVTGSTQTIVKDLGTINASDFIKDGMLDTVTWKETAEGARKHTLVLTFNTESGKEPIELDLDNILPFEANQINMEEEYVEVEFPQGNDETTMVGEQELSNYPTGAVAINNTDTVSSALHKVDTSISALTQALLDDEYVIASVLNAMNLSNGFTINAEYPDYSGTEVETSAPNVASANSVMQALINIDQKLSQLAELKNIVSNNPNISIENTDGVVNVGLQWIDL